MSSSTPTTVVSGDATEDWDAMVDDYKAVAHRGHSLSIDEDDLPPPPPPPPASTSSHHPPPPPPPANANHANPGPAGIAAALNARFANQTPPRPTIDGGSNGPTPVNRVGSGSTIGPPQLGGIGGLAAAVAGRNASGSQSQTNSPGTNVGRRDSHPPPPPPPQRPGPPPPPPNTNKPTPLVTTTETTTPTMSSSPPPLPSSAGLNAGPAGSVGGVHRPSLLNVFGAAAKAMGGAAGAVASDMLDRIKSSGGSLLAPVMQELSTVYQAFPDSGSLAREPHLRKSMASVKVIVTAPIIKRRHAPAGSPNGLKSPTTHVGGVGDDEDGTLWEENRRPEQERVWLRFIEPKSGSVLYFNLQTNSAQGERPSTYDGSDDDEDDDDDGGYADEEDLTNGVNDGLGRGSLAQEVVPGMPTPVNFASPRRARQESVILSTAWDENNSSSKGHTGSGSISSGPSTPSSHAIDPRLLGPPGSKGSISSRSSLMVGGRRSVAQSNGQMGDEDETFVPLSTVDGTKNGTLKSVISFESFLSSSTLYLKQLEQLLSGPSGGGPALTDEMEAKLKLLLVDLQDVNKLMDETARGGDSGNEVDSLVSLSKLPWDFSADNQHVQRYRKLVSKIDHTPFEYKSYHLPQYLSTFPLPPDTKSVTMIVKLPDVSSGQRDGDNATVTTRIGVSQNDSCAQAVSQAFKKCEGKLVDKSLTVNDFVLKGTGIADFMYGDTKIMDYESIRMAIRNGEDVKLSLVRRPVPQPDPEVVQTFVPNYMSKVDPALEVHDPNIFRDVTSRDLKYIPMHEVTLPFRFKLLAVDNVNETSLPRFDTISNLYVKAFIFYGCKNVVDVMKSEVQELCSGPRWYQWFHYKDLTLSSLPRGARLGFILYGNKISKPEKEVMLAWTVHQLVDDQGYLSTGRHSFNLWSMESRKKGKHGKPREPDVSFLQRATTAQNLSDPSPVVLTIQLDEFNLPVVAPVIEKIREPNSKLVAMELPLKNMSKDQQKQFDGLLACDILKELTQEDQILLWNYRHHLVKHPGALGKFLQCVNWGKIEDRMEAYRLLRIWSPPYAPVSALELLDAKFPDPVVREHAIGILRQLKDDELRNYLLQLVQCLKFEPYHDSPLKRFLIERALANPMNVGHYFFWHLKAEVHHPFCCERFGLILEEYLSFAGRFTLELKKQASAVLKLQRIAEMVVRLKRDHGYSDPEAMKEYTKECEKLNKDFFLPQGKFQLPLDPKVEVTSLVVEKCRYMSSKMVPLWLVFKNADPDAPNVFVIFKSGDDLRQDILTLQILKLMDGLWLGSTLDCRMKPYKCIATGVNEHGEGVGLIEVVGNSDTTSGIQLKYGGGAVGALKMDPIDKFLQEHNKIPKDYEKAVENFVQSCAGYCVATFVLGIGDRHNDIDFGHFLGNFKQKFGINRERAAFVFTPEMAFVMGGNSYRKSDHFKKFLSYCSKAFLTLRKHANLLENLFGLMVAAGMPELIQESDIYYMRDKLLLNEKESKAEKKLNEEIENSLDSKYRRFDNFIHNMRHG